MDDRRDNLFVLREVIESLLPGCRAEVASGAVEALRRLRSGGIDGALIDVQMPGMNGIELCRVIQTDPEIPEVPVLLITAYRTTAEERVLGLEAGATDFIGKPIDNAELVAKIRVLLRLREAGDELRDTNQRLAAELGDRTEQLDETRSRFRLFFDRLPIGMLVVSYEQSGAVVAQEWECNPAFRRMLGVATGEPVGPELLAQLAPADVRTCRQWLADVADGGPDTLDLELSIPTPAGRWLRATLGLLRDENGLALEIFASVQDITARRQAETALARSEHLASLGMLAAGIAHEINNPLTYVHCGIDELNAWLPRIRDVAVQTRSALERRIGPTEASVLLGRTGATALEGGVEELIETGRDADEGVGRLRAITRSLQTFSRMGGEDEGVGTMDVNRALEDAAELARHQIKHVASIAWSLGSVPAARGSAGRLAQVFLNLVVNAAQAIDEGDHVGNTIHLRTRFVGGEVVIEVEDTGCGIPAAQLGLIFDPFFTTKPEGRGTGLGLSLCRDIVEHAGGRLEVESKPGRGSIFRVLLPAVDGESQQVEPPTGRHDVHDVARARILVVDDEPSVLAAVQHALAGRHDLVTAPSGRAALDVVRSGRRIDLVLTDAVMPDGSGAELLTALEGEYPKLVERVVVMTGASRLPEVRELLARVGERNLLKPFGVRELRDAVARTLEEVGRVE